jgi:hypothetical protein
VRMQCNPYTQCSQHLRDHAKTGGHEESDREDDHGGHLRLVGRRLWLAQSKQRRACARVCASRGPTKVCPRLQLARRGQLSSLSRNRGAARWYRADPRCRDQTRGREHGDRATRNTVSETSLCTAVGGGYGTDHEWMDGPLCLGVRDPGIAELRSVVSRVAS